ncbi:hypothetical protein [Nocardia fusca]|uniref:Uncharacterized protein n=1 Tax=Nocardia fusca TaxID=941183 RepID=A0ABV3FF79_9NOCA
MDPAHAIALLELDPDREFPTRVIHTIGDPSLATEITAEFDSSLEWLMGRLTTPGDEPVTLADVIKLDFFIWGCMPADTEGNPTAADMVEDHLDHRLEVVRGIVVDAMPKEP